MDRRRWEELLALAAAAGVTYGAAAAGAAATRPRIGGWYQRLDKPRWTPPAAAFGPVWGVLYGMQALAAWTAWRAGRPGRRRALAWYAAQLALNTGWSLVFFGLRQPGWALVEVGALWLAVAAATRELGRQAPAAAWLMLPYLGWVSFAAALNAEIWRRARRADVSRPGPVGRPTRHGEYRTVRGRGLSCSWSPPGRQRLSGRSSPRRPWRAAG